MSEAKRNIRIVSNDEALLTSVRGSAASLKGWDMAEPQTVEDLVSGGAVPGDIILLDAWLRTENVDESCRRLTGKVKCRIYVVTDERNGLSDEIATFCGATGTLARPLSGEVLQELVESEANRRRSMPEDNRNAGGLERDLPESLLRDLIGDGAGRLIDALTDPETGLYSYEYLSFKLDEEYKRALRFNQPLSCVMLGFDGQVNDEVLSSLASIFLNASRDTDLLGRFDQSSFLFFLPNTGPDGAEVMGTRIRAAAEEQGLRDLVGDVLQISVGISFCPHPDVKRREDLFSRARTAFFTAQHEGGVVVNCD